MRLEQKTFTTIYADEGKVLRRKSDGWIVGDHYPLGYNYYDAGVGLPEKKLETPEDYEEIDAPEGWTERQVINQVKRLQRTDELIKQNTKGMNSLHLSPTDALQVKHWYPTWGVDEGFLEGDEIEKGTWFQYEDKLYAAMQTHTIQAIYPPSIHTAALYTEVTEDYNEEDEENGTRENPIEYNGNMALENGKYYTQDGVVYLCTRDTINPVYNALKDFVGLYVEVA